MAGSSDWAHPPIDFRAAHAITGGVEPTSTSPRVDILWAHDSAEPESYSTARRRVALVCVAINAGDRTLYVPPKNLFRTAENQINSSAREFRAIGRWSSSSEMTGRYDRVVCDGALILRNTIIQMVVGGRPMAPSFHPPETAEGGRHIGKPVDIAASPADGTEQPAPSLPGAPLPNAMDNRISPAG